MWLSASSDFFSRIGINAFHDNAAGVDSRGKQNGFIDGGRGRLNAGDLGKLSIELLVIVDTVRARLGEADVRRDAEQAILKSFAEAGVHRQRDNERGDSCGYSNDGEQCDQPQDGRPVRRAQISPRNHPFKSHGVAPRGLGGFAGCSGEDSFAVGASLRS